MVDPNSFMLPTTLDQENVMANQHYLDEFNKERELAEAEAEDETDEWVDGQGDAHFEDLPYVEGTLEDNLNFNNFPELTMEDNSFHSLNSEGSILKHLAEMELTRAGQSTSDSGKRKNLGGDWDTASSDMVEAKKPKI